MAQTHDTFRVILIGDSGVGKSCLLLRFAEDSYNTTFPTAGIDFKCRYTDIQGRVVKLQIWDSAGQEKFRSMVASYYHGAHGIILAYDTTNRSTFDNLGHWLQEVKKYARRSCPVVLVGTKTDLKDHRAVSEEAVREFAERYCGGANSRVETSAKTNDGVDQAFQLLAEQIFLQTVTASDDSDTSREGLCLPQSLRGDALTLNRDPCSC